MKWICSVGLIVLAGCSHHPPLYVEKPCSIVAHSEDPSGKFVEYTVRCLEYTGRSKGDNLSYKLSHRPLKHL